MATQQQRYPPPHFASLPSEIICAILSQLSFRSARVLRQTNTRVHAIVSTNDPLHRFKRFNSVQEFIQFSQVNLDRLIMRVTQHSTFLKSANAGNLADWVLSRMVRTRFKIVAGDEVEDESEVIDGILIQVSLKDNSKKGDWVAGTGNVRLTVAENYGIEGGVRIYAKSNFVMPAMNSNNLCSFFRKWDPGYVTLLSLETASVQLATSSPSITSSSSSSAASSPTSTQSNSSSTACMFPKNFETRALFPKSITRNSGYFGNPGMRYIPCDANLAKTLDSVLNEGLGIEFHADCNIGFCPEVEQGQAAGAEWDVYSLHSPPHDVNVFKTNSCDVRGEKFIVRGAERGEISVCLLGGVHGMEPASCALQTISYLKMLGTRWIELYS
ncbi:hypothetical protein BJ741DRAFT_607985 [Chytriomyces cf. hyalinus JEL632]|nr:hypothetical protein BJ741DRAFT_607985 [Chytriomyces cf. hyalinus JEL632]